MALGNYSVPFIILSEASAVLVMEVLCTFNHHGYAAVCSPRHSGFSAVVHKGGSSCWSPLPISLTICTVNQIPQESVQELNPSGLPLRVVVSIKILTTIMGTP